VGLIKGLAEARAEAEISFKDGSVFLEKYLDKPRHVEVQLIGDKHGNVIHLYERDCSCQRRHQKLVEESPAPNLPEKVRNEMCEAAVRLAKTAGYYNAGTCEFLVDQNNKYYFIEVNARIQVEHPVTELVTGVDLIREQIRVAAGEKLQYRQKDIVHRGAAIEVRINAEDTTKDFRPSAGTITTWRPPGGPGVRLDSHVVPGYRVPPNYDSMVAKLLVYQPTRAEAIAAMKRALREFQVEGIATTIPIHQRILDTPEFIAGTVDTKFIERAFYPAKGS
jgi:acetyl-CoA carboxylase, biotin carboxylase subunit